MKSGRDFAKFLTKHTGKDYVGLYDASVKEEQVQMENIKKEFKGLVNRINESDKKRFIDIIDN